MVGGNGYSRLPGNLDIFIPGNRGMKKSQAPGNEFPIKDIINDLPV